MAKIMITKDSELSPNGLKKLLEQTATDGSILEDLLSLLRELIDFENQYNLASDLFYARFMRGEMGDELPFMMWAGQYESYLETKQAITKQLKKSTVLA